MGSYIRHVSNDKVFLNSKDFQRITDEIHNEVRKNKWKMYDWMDEVMSTNQFTQIAEIFGVTLEPEKDAENEQIFSVNLDGAYASSFLPLLFRIIAPFTSDGILHIGIEEKTISVAFQAGIVDIKQEPERF